MKRPSFLQGAALGLVISIAGALLFVVFSTLFSHDAVIRWIIAASGLVYIVHIIHLNRVPVGSLTALIVWTATSALLLWLPTSLVFYLATHVSLIWLIRSLFYYSSILSAFADFGLSLLGICSAIWAALTTGNIFLSIWCYFLVQALTCAIPLHFPLHYPLHYPLHFGKLPNDSTKVQGDRFQNAHHLAETALRRISSIH